MLLIAACCYAGLCALCLAMPRHHRQWRGHATGSGATRGLRAAGTVLLVAAFWLAAMRWGVGVGLVLAVVATGAAGMVLAALLAWRPRWVFLLALAWPALGLVMLAF